MITEIIMWIVGEMVGGFGQAFPGYGTYPLLIPWGLDDYLVQGINGYKTLAQSFPPMGIALQCFIIYITFKIAVQLLKAVPLLGRTLSKD